MVVTDRAGLAILLFCSFAAAESSEPQAPGPQKPVMVIAVLADDLGYHDTNWKNNQTLTPTLDHLVQTGVEIPDFYV